MFSAQQLIVAHHELRAEDLQHILQAERLAGDERHRCGVRQLAWEILLVHIQSDAGNRRTDLVAKDCLVDYEASHFVVADVDVVRPFYV